MNTSISFKCCIIFLFTILFVACNGQKSELTKIKIGYLPIVGDLPIFVAYEKNFFKDEGFDVELVEFHSGNEAMNAVITNKITIEATIGYSTIFTVWEKEPKGFYVVLSTVEEGDKYGSSIVARKNSPINKIEDIKGRKIGTYTGLTHLITTKLILQKYFNPDKDVKIVQVDPSLQVQALEANQFDALFSIEPYPTIAIQKGFAKMIAPNARANNILSPFWAAGTIVSSQFARENPEKVRSLIRALNKAVDFIAQNDSTVRSILVKYTPLEKDIVEKVPLYKWVKLGDENKEVIQKLADLMKDSGLLKKKINTNSLFYIIK
jgi:NitT/TauT family transport system substrate-binding protein